MAEIEVVIRVGNKKKELLAPKEVSVRALLSKASELMGEDFFAQLEAGQLVQKKIMRYDDLDKSLHNAGIQQMTVIAIERPAVEQEKARIREKDAPREKNTYQFPNRKK